MKEKNYNLFISASTIIQNIEGVKEVIVKMSNIYNIYILTKKDEYSPTKEFLEKEQILEYCLVLEKESSSFQLEKGINIGLVDNSMTELKTDLEMGFICLGVLFSQDKKKTKTQHLNDEIKTAYDWFEVAEKFIR